MIRIAIAEDHNSLIDGIELFVEFEDDIKLVGHATNGQELLQILDKRQIDLVVTDIRMPLMDGFELVKIIRHEQPDIKLVVFTMFDSTNSVQKMSALGVDGYVLKNSKLSTLLKAIRKVHKGDQYFDPRLENPTENSTQRDTLTKREKEILNLIVEGKSNPEIAQILFIQRVTVETHRKNMIRKLNLSGSGELLRYGLQRRYS